MAAATFDGAELILRIYAQPKSSKDALVGLHGDELKVTITAPPVDGKANTHLIKFIAKQFKVAKSQVSLIKGDTSRHKTLSIVSPNQFPSVIQSLLDP